MKKTKTQKGIKASIAGFILYMFASLSLSLHLCMWMLIYIIAGVFWLAGIGWIYSEHEDFREQHKKSVDISAWLFGAAVFILFIGIAYLSLQSYTYLTIGAEQTLTKDDTHALFTGNIVFGYLQLFALVILGLSRTFALYELENKMGKRVIIIALIAMLVISTLVFMQYNSAYQDTDQKNSRNPENAFFKKDLDKQFNTIYTQNTIYLMIPIVHELLFTAAYYLVGVRLASGELKSRTKED